MGLYTKEEVEDGDFKEYTVEDVSTQVQSDLENANSQEFIDDEEVPEFAK